MSARFLAAALAALPLLALAQDLPMAAEKAPRKSDAALLPDDGADPLFPKVRFNDADFLRSIEPPNVEKAKASLDQALRKEERWQKLGRTGVLAQVEVERATLAAARARARFEHARAAQQDLELGDLRTRGAAGAVPAEAIAAAEAALSTARAMADEAEATLRRTELLLAESNVDRQRRLLKMGVGSRSQLQRAESALAQLRAAPRNDSAPPSDVRPAQTAR